MVNIVKKAYFYIKETVKLQHLKFSEEEIAAFDKSAREYRSNILIVVKQFKQAKEAQQQQNLVSLPAYDSSEMHGEMPSKITILQPSAYSEPKIITKHIVAPPHKKESTSMKVKILAPPSKKIPKVETLQPKEETEEDIIKKEMAQYLNEIRSEYET